MDIRSLAFNIYAKYQGENIGLTYQLLNQNIPLNKMTKAQREYILGDNNKIDKSALNSLNILWMGRILVAPARAQCQLQHRPSDSANKPMRIAPPPADIQIPIANTILPRDINLLPTKLMSTLTSKVRVAIRLQMVQWSLCMMNAVAWITRAQVVIG